VQLNGNSAFKDKIFRFFLQLGCDGYNPTRTRSSINHYFDQTKAAITFTPNANLSKGPDLWTTNPTLTALCQNYFDTVWKQTSQ
jgi:hypothetical protein